MQGHGHMNSKANIIAGLQCPGLENILNLGDRALLWKQILLQKQIAINVSTPRISSNSNQYRWSL